MKLFRYLLFLILISELHDIHNVTNENGGKKVIVNVAGSAVQSDDENKKTYQKRGFLYVGDRKYCKIIPQNNGWRVKCCTTKGCVGRGVYDENTRTVIQEDTETHSPFCKPIKYIETVDKFKADYQRYISLNDEAPRNIFAFLNKNFQRKYPGFPVQSYKEYKNITSYAKSKVNPKLSK